MGLLSTSCCPAPGREKTKLRELALDHRVTGDRFYSYVSTVGQRLSQKAPSLEEGVLFISSQDVRGGAESSAESESPVPGRPRRVERPGPHGESAPLPGCSFSLLSSHNTRSPPPGAPLPASLAGQVGPPPVSRTGAKSKLQDARVHGSSAGPLPEWGRSLPGLWESGFLCAGLPATSKPLGSDAPGGANHQVGSARPGWLAPLLAASGSCACLPPGRLAGRQPGGAGKPMGVPRWGFESSSSVPGHVTWVGRLTPLPPSLKLARRTP